MESPNSLYSTNTINNNTTTTTVKDGSSGGGGGGGGSSVSGGGGSNGGGNNIVGGFDSATLGSNGSDNLVIPSNFLISTKEIIARFPHNKRVGHYLLGRKLGEGSFAKVKEGLQTLTGQKVGIKSYKYRFKIPYFPLFWSKKYSIFKRFLIMVKLSDIFDIFSYVISVQILIKIFL